jgi:hypothetical protein
VTVRIAFFCPDSVARSFYFVHAATSIALLCPRSPGNGMRCILIWLCEIDKKELKAWLCAFPTAASSLYVTQSIKADFFCE